MPAPGTMPSPPFIIIGAGGHAAVLIDTLHQAGNTILGCVDPAIRAGTAGPLGTPVLGDDDVLTDYPPQAIVLVNGIGTTDATNGPGGQRRETIHRLWRQRGYGFATVIHPAATIGGDCVIDDGAQIMAGTVVQTGTRISSGAIVNTGARIDHGCNVGALVHVAPGAILCGNVTVAAGAFIGAGATLVPGVHIGAQSRIGAGMTIIGDVPSGVRLSPSDGQAWRGDADVQPHNTGPIRIAATNN